MIAIPSLSNSLLDPWCAPMRVRLRHGANQRADVGWYRWTAGAATALPHPVPPQALAMPREDGRRLNDDQWASPSRPHAREPDPEDAISARESRSGRTRPFEDVNLLSQGEQFELQFNARSEAAS